MLSVTRLVIVALSALALLAGLAVVSLGWQGLGGLWLLIAGAAGLIGVTFERMRYRSEAAELSGEHAGPAGAEDGPLDPRFRPTEERFVDPTTRQRLRVWVDPASGERRYRLDP